MQRRSSCGDIRRSIITTSLLMGLGYVGGRSAQRGRRGGWGVFGGGVSGAEEKSQNVFACSPSCFCLLERSRMKRRRSPDRIRAAPLEDRSWNCELSLGHASTKRCDANAANGWRTTNIS